MFSLSRLPSAICLISKISNALCFWESSAEDTLKQISDNLCLCWFCCWFAYVTEVKAMALVSPRQSTEFPSSVKQIDTRHIEGTSQFLWFWNLIILDFHFFELTCFFSFYLCKHFVICYINYIVYNAVRPNMTSHRFLMHTIRMAVCSSDLRRRSWQWCRFGNSSGAIEWPPSSRCNRLMSEDPVARNEAIILYTMIIGQWLVYSLIDSSSFYVLIWQVAGSA